jgi:hypothetical protein
MIKSRAGHVERMGEIINAYKILIERTEDGRVILKMNLG